MQNISPNSIVPLNTNEKMGSIHQTILLGKKILHVFPKIANDYLLGKSMRDICIKYEIHTFYNIPLKTAINAVRFALKGYDNEIHTIIEFPYEWLLNKEQYKSASQQVCHNTRVRAGKILAENKQGMFAISASERGKKGGKASLEQQVGIHDPSRQYELRVASILALGRTPVSAEEKSAIFVLAQHPDYQKGSRLNLAKIVQEINTSFHDGKSIRTGDSIQKIIKKMKDTP